VTIAIPEDRLRVADNKYSALAGRVSVLID
jgi:hypothetical protein